MEFSFRFTLPVGGAIKDETIDDIDISIRTALLPTTTSFKMKFFIVIMAVAFVAASEASYLPYADDLSYQSYGYGLPLSKVVVGSSYGLPAAVDKYSYPSYYSSYPALKKVVEYPSVAPVLATKVVDNSYGLGYNKLVAPVVATKVVDNSYGLGYNKLVSPVLASGYGLGYNKLVSPVVDNGLYNYGGYGLGYNKYLSAAPVAKYVL
ncbi:uncharacterized protein LOC118514299 isoform X2 [Anopheles stephensi]|uniref:uncharacterized protein LOC118514298 isoform X2 n=1 Tax=Anopheles stephensi TaxID=30069 RepID=UPI001658C397|nr:uncharacterized protein LOC118514298 isoform X2 [Anopheles stephensi]XP_035916970.1 uncharacterized protein LOC118514299 isoform X2 [Anopheles stephensi]